jgi:hypothetical protein
MELCPAVNQEDLEMLKNKFQTKNDQRFKKIFEKRKYLN